jgi:hypothetical protein
VELTKHTVASFAARRSTWAIALAAIVWTGATLPAAARAHRHERVSQPLTAETVNAARYDGRVSSRRQSAVVLKAQVLLDRLNFSPGAIDAKSEENVAKALACERPVLTSDL